MQQDAATLHHADTRHGMRRMIAVGIIVAVLIGLRLAMPRLGNSAAEGIVEREGRRELADCGTSPNCQGSFSTRTEQTVAPFPMQGSVSETMAALTTLLESQAGARIVSTTGGYVHATFTTATMGYVDDIEFLIDESRNEVGVRSASRLGKSDLGANAKRIERLRSAWQNS